MWYPNQPPYRRRGRGGFGIPFVFPFIILVFSHSFGAFLSTLVLTALIFLIVNAVRASQTNNSGPTVVDMTQQWQQRQQTPYYQPPTPIYQPPAQQPYYRSYEQGYAPAEETKASTEQPAAQMPGSYEDYEQPQAQYPEQMPPMQ